MKYYDMHTHILPGVDDGSQDMETSMKMLHIAKEEGIECIVATPHFMRGKMNYTRERLSEVYEVWKEKAEQMGIRLLLGNEIFYEEDTAEKLKKGEILTLADTSYVLVEFDVGVSYKKMYRAMRTLIERGYRPIIAHMERYDHLNKDTDRILELKKLGCYMQMNTDSVIGGTFDSYKRYCRKLIREGYIDLLGSDCHEAKYRKPLMKEAIEYLRKKKVKESTLDKISRDNIEKLLANKYL